jgi:hypothetical protein
MLVSSIFSGYTQSRARLLCADQACYMHRQLRQARARQAEVLVYSIPDSGWQAQALARVSEALAGARQYEQAEALARRINDPDWQATALVGVAEALTRAEDTYSACRVAASICAIGRWTTSARPILQLDPSASAFLVHILNDSWRLQLRV